MPPRRFRLAGLALAAGLVCAISLAAAAAGAEDPLHSAGCRQALGNLQAREAAAASAVGTAGASGAAAGPAASPSARPPRAMPDPRLAAARREARIACLATRADPPPRPASGSRAPPPATAGVARLARPPIAVPSLAGTAGRAAALPSPGTAAPPPSRPGPRFITSCDAGGCWGDDGSRLDRVGPELRNGRGACSVQGTVVTCP